MQVSFAQAALCRKRWWANAGGDGRMSDEEERDGLQRGNQLAGNLYPPHFEASTIFVLQVQMAFIAGNQTSPNLARETVGGKFVLTSF